MKSILKYRQTLNHILNGKTLDTISIQFLNFDARSKFMIKFIKLIFLPRSLLVGTDDYRQGSNSIPLQLCLGELK